MPAIRGVLGQIAIHNGKIFFLQNMFFTLHQKPLCSHPVFGKQNNARGLLVEPSDWTDTNGVLFILEIGSYLIGKGILIMYAGWMSKYSGWFAYGKDILVFIQNVKRRKIL